MQVAAKQCAQQSGTKSSDIQAATEREKCLFFHNAPLTDNLLLQYIIQLQTEQQAFRATTETDILHNLWKADEVKHIRQKIKLRFHVLFASESKWGPDRGVWMAGPESSAL